MNVALPGTSLPFVAPPHPCITSPRGLSNCSWWGGGASVLSVLSQCLWVYYRLSLPWRSPAASHSLRVFSLAPHGNTNTRRNTQALCGIWTLLTLCSLSSSYVGLFVAAVPELGEENRENKAREETEGWRKEDWGAGGGGGGEEEKGGDEWEREREREREGANVHITSKVSPVVARWTSATVCAPQLDLGVVPSCARRQRHGDVAEALIRRA